jgi:hypothetical protein
MAFRKNAEKYMSTMNISQKNMIVEIVRILDKHLDLCFPQMSRENFMETFSGILYTMPDQEEEKITPLQTQPTNSKNSRLFSDVENPL